MTTATAITLHEITDASAHGVPSFSPFCLKVLLTLDALALPYTRAHGPFPAHWKALNPTGQVPVVTVGNEVIADSTLIVRRLRSLSKRGLNDGFTAKQEAEALLYEELADAEVNGFVVAARWADARNWPRTRDVFFANAPLPVRLVVSTLAQRARTKQLVARDVWRQGPDACWARFGLLLDALEARAPATGFWLAETLSTADIALAAQLKSLQTPLTPWQAGEVSRRPALNAWIGRVMAATSTST